MSRQTRTLTQQGTSRQEIMLINISKIEEVTICSKYYNDCYVLQTFAKSHFYKKNRFKITRL